MHVALETLEQTDTRLRGVIRTAEFAVLPNAWYFDEFEDASLATLMHPRAISLIRDGDRWSQLIPVEETSAEPLLVWSFHFPAEIDNSGFVGWLASFIKAETGSGVAVICGQNSKHGGIFDYWCCPLQAASQVLACVEKLRVK